MQDDPKKMVREGYDAVSVAYETLYGDEARVQPLVKTLHERLPADGSVLDLGCGSGIPMARMLAEKFAVRGVDISPIQIERAREKVPHARFVCADMTRLAMTDETFDGIVAMWSIIHLPLNEQQGLLNSIARWLKPGGLFVTTLGDQAYEGTEENWLGVDGARMYFSHSDAKTYREWLQTAGLTLIKQGTISEPRGDGRHSLFVAERPM